MNTRQESDAFLLYSAIPFASHHDTYTIDIREVAFYVPGLTFTSVNQGRAITLLPSSDVLDWSKPLYSRATGIALPRLHTGFIIRALQARMDDSISDGPFSIRLQVNARLAKSELLGLLRSCCGVCTDWYVVTTYDCVSARLHGTEFVYYLLGGSA